mmetsp:Transcript_27223/g.58717  ORF Transcript_27223/g.58717 Transcript_27223/m.58717 type:complete len:410 (+) Transcript_27223:231-1460(+)
MSSRSKRKCKKNNSSAPSSYFLQNSTDHDDTNPDSEAYAPPLICNSGTNPLKFLPRYFFFLRRNQIKLRCVFWTSEIEYPLNTNIAPMLEKVYTMVREPISHVVSQYFHCTESIDHARTKDPDTGELLNRHSRMPSLDAWLESYAELAKTVRFGKLLPSELLWHPKIIELRQRFKCYCPVDSESAFVRFPPMKSVGTDTGTNSKDGMIDLPEHYTYPYYKFKFDAKNNQEQDENDRDEATQRLDRELFDDLKRRFRVIGDMAQMTKTICAIFIDFAEGKHIPTACDCTHNPDNIDINNSIKIYSEDTSTVEIRNLYSDPNYRGNGGRLYSRTFTLGYDRERDSHGVKHHGSSFASKNLTSHQKNLIQTVIRKRDAVLYNVSRAVFDEQVREMEADYGIKLCDRWNRKTN